MSGAAGLSPRAWDGRLRHSRDQEDPLLLTPLTHHHDNDDDDDYPANSHHDKNPPWWEFVSNEYGGNMPVTKSHH